MGSLWASVEDRGRLQRARSAVFLVGGYDGSGNYGDVLQLAVALETARALPGAPLAVAIAERETLGHHRHLWRRFPDVFGGAACAHFDAGPERPGDGLVELPVEAAPRRSVVHVYGGGFLNLRWGARKIDHLGAVERLVGEPRPTVVATGQQLDEGAVAPGGHARELLARASWVGARDPLSHELLRRHALPARGPDPVLAGDDATPLLRRRVRGDAPPREPVVNFHFNEASWVSDEPERTAARLADLLVRIGATAESPLRLRPVIAYEDPRVSERQMAAGFLERHGAQLSAAGIEAVPPLDLLSDALEGGLRELRDARLTLACSYHVTLTSLMGGVPALVLAENEYYEQKTAGLRDLFGLDGSLVGVRGVRRDAEAAAAVAVDGAERSALVEHLRAVAVAVGERCDRAHAEATASLAEGLRHRGPLERIRRRLASVRSGAV